MLGEYTIRTLDDFFEIIQSLSSEHYDEKTHNWWTEQFWYRGHAKSSYELTTNLYRNDAFMEAEQSKIRLKENQRSFNFRARAHSHVYTAPESNLEWEEMMQHYGVKTRLMDWTESAINSLIFALEPFLNPESDEKLEAQRKTALPCVWLIKPYELNSKVYDFFSNSSCGYSYLEKAVEAVVPWYFSNLQKKDFVNNLYFKMKSNKSCYFGELDSKPFDDPMITGLIDLSSIAVSFDGLASEVIFRMLGDDEINPFHYILKRYYVDGLGASIDNDEDILPPLAIMQPYHSERIRAQRGVFTIFPYYGLTQRTKCVHSIGIDLRAMNQQRLVRDSVCKIILSNPLKIARELLLIGERRSGIYPELAVYAADIEAKGYHLK